MNIIKTSNGIWDSDVGDGQYSIGWSRKASQKVALSKDPNDKKSNMESWLSSSQAEGLEAGINLLPLRNLGETSVGTRLGKVW